MAITTATTQNSGQRGDYNRHAGQDKRRQLASSSDGVDSRTVVDGRRLRRRTRGLSVLRQVQERAEQDRRNQRDSGVDADRPLKTGGGQGRPCRSVSPSSAG